MILPHDIIAGSLPLLVLVGAACLQRAGRLQSMMFLTLELDEAVADWHARRLTKLIAASDRVRAGAGIRDPYKD